MTGFNDGIDAAAKRLREISHEGLKDSWWRERFESAARSVEALKRPEPSGAEKPSPVVQSKVVCSEVEQLLRRAESLIAAGKGLPFKPSFGMLVIEWLREIQKGSEQ